MSSTGYDLITEEMFQEALDRIEVLEAALREVFTNEIMTARKIARAALNKGESKLSGFS